MISQVKGPGENPTARDLDFEPPLTLPGCCSELHQVRVTIQPPIH